MFPNNLRTNYFFKNNNTLNYEYIMLQANKHINVISIRNSYQLCAPMIQDSVYYLKDKLLYNPLIM
jgi:hypothetical protein